MKSVSNEDMTLDQEEFFQNQQLLAEAMPNIESESSEKERQPDTPRNRFIKHQCWTTTDARQFMDKTFAKRKYVDFQGDVVYQKAPPLKRTKCTRSEVKYASIASMVTEGTTWVVEDEWYKVYNDPSSKPLSFSGSHLPPKATKEQSVVNDGQKVAALSSSSIIFSATVPSNTSATNGQAVGNDGQTGAALSSSSSIFSATVPADISATNGQAVGNTPTGPADTSATNATNPPTSATNAAAATKATSSSSSNPAWKQSCPCATLEHPGGAANQHTICGTPMTLFPDKGVMTAKDILQIWTENRKKEGKSQAKCGEYNHASATATQCAAIIFSAYAKVHKSVNRQTGGGAN
jgi:hypothetical protein